MIAMLSPIDDVKVCEQYQKDIARLIAAFGGGSDLAVELDVSENDISRWKRGRFKSLPSYNIVIRVMTLLGYTSLDDYLDHLQKGTTSRFEKMSERGDVVMAKSLIGQMSKPELLELLQTTTTQLASK